MNFSGTYHTEKHSAHDTAASVDITAVKKGFCKNHTDIKTHGVGAILGVGGKDIPCFRCAEEHTMKMEQQRFQFDQLRMQSGSEKETERVNY